MTFAEIRKAAVAVLGAIVAIVPQILGSLTGVIPAGVASWLTIIAAVCTAVLVYLVPNTPKDPLGKARASLDALGPVFDVIRHHVRREVEARLAPVSKFDVIAFGEGAGGGGGNGGWPHGSSGGGGVVPPPDPDPFVVTPRTR